VSVRSLVERPGFAWTDIEPAGDPDGERLLAGLGVAPPPWPDDRELSPLAIEGRDHTGVMLVGAVPGGELVGVKCLLSEDWLVTIHQGPIPLDADGVRGTTAGLERVAQTVVTTLIAAAGRLEGELEEVAEGDREDLDDLRRKITRMRRVILLQHDLLTRLGETARDRDADAARGLRNAATRMSQLGVSLESLREELHEAMADRRDEVVRRLTALAAVFLPLTFLTGFFGQNFGWLVDHIESPAAFAGLAIALPVAMVASLLYAFHRRGWL
jgi:magnesium transporter